MREDLKEYMHVDTKHNGFFFPKPDRRDKVASRMQLVRVYIHHNPTLVPEESPKKIVAGRLWIQGQCLSSHD